MRMILLFHILAGGLGLLSGYIALSTSKGAPLHRKVGMFFVYVMTTMAVSGMLISVVQGVAPAINIPTALLTLYLVITSLTTVRPPRSGARRLEIAAMLGVAALGLTCVALGIRAIAKGGPEAGMAYPLFIFGGVALSAGAGDRRMIRAGGLRGAPRLARHLWRMCFAIFIASIAFYPRLARIDGFPKPLVALPILAVLVVMFYWVWRVRGRQTFRGISRPQATSIEARASL